MKGTSRVKSVFISFLKEAYKELWCHLTDTLAFYTSNIGYLKWI